MLTSRRSWLALLTAAVLTAAGTVPAAAQGRDVLVFAAASLKNALDDIAAQWQRESGKKAAISYAASNTLIKQIEQGAPADIFISADLDWMDYGQQKGLIKPDTRSNLLGNRLVLVAPKDSNISANIRPGSISRRCSRAAGLPWATWTRAGRQIRQGRAREARCLGWHQGQDRAGGKRARRAPSRRAREAPLGVVYQTDAASDPTVKIVGTFPRIRIRRSSIRSR
jgi:molybdate transport system substrate-binding protein